MPNIDIRKLLAEQASEVEITRALEITAVYWQKRCEQAEKKLQLIEKEISDYDQADKRDPDFVIDNIALMLGAREVE